MSRPKPHDGDSPDAPIFQFRGIWVPAEILDSVLKRQISRDQFCLLMIIEAFVKFDGDGCFASNRYLAKVLDVHHMSVSRMISIMEKSGHVKIHYKDGRRFLETVWSRSVKGVNPIAYPKPPALRGGKPPALTIIRNNTKDNNTRNGQTADSEDNGESMCFKPELKKKPSPSIKDRHLKLADKLQQAVIQKTKRYRAYKRTSWASHFAYLDKSASPTRVDQALDYIIEWMGKPYIPVVQSARSFRDKFDKIEASMIRNKPDEKVELSEDGLKLAKRIKNFGWKLPPSDLNQSVAVTLKNFKQFRINCLKTQWNSDRLSRFGAHVLNNYGSPLSFTENWFESMHHKLNGWGDWSGQLMPWSFNVDHKDFKKQLMNLASGYTAGSPSKLADEFMEVYRRAHN